MALNLVDLETVLAEIQPVLTGGWIQKIHQPQTQALTFDVRALGASVMMYICAEPRLARLHFISKRYPNPPTPPPFCQFLRSHLEGGRIEEVTQQAGDRLVYVKIRKDEKAYMLVIALLGNRANVLLLNEKHLLLRSLKESRVQIGGRFVPPATRSSPSSQTSSIWREGEIENPSHEEESFATKYPVSAILEAYYDKKENEENQRTLHEQQLAQARKSLKVAKEKLRALQEDLKKAERYREYARASGHEQRPGDHHPDRLL
jgi:predicted ribosome quality control (RQC) complex YloA/Tae2 family protein